MATWQVEIDVLDLPEKRIHVTGIRTDGADVSSYSARGQLDAGDVQASYERLLENDIFSQHEAAVAKAAAEQIVVEPWEISGAAFLDGLETP